MARKMQWRAPAHLFSFANKIADLEIDCAA